jgi:hypothetical protein
MRASARAVTRAASGHAAAPPMALGAPNTMLALLDWNQILHAPRATFFLF